MITPTEPSVESGQSQCAQPVWVFAEERSGSTWLTDTLALRLRRRHRYLEMDQEAVPDLEWAWRVRDNPYSYSALDAVFQTHRFAVLASLPGKPIVLRTTRRDSFEHILSYFFLESTRQRYPEFWRLPHLFADTDPAYFRHIVDSSRGLTVTRPEVEAWFDKKRARDALWRQHAAAYDSQTVYYEDLAQGVAIRSLNAHLSFASSSGVRKLPYDKYALFPNLEQIRAWVSECAGGPEPLRGTVPSPPIPVISVPNARAMQRAPFGANATRPRTAGPLVGIARTRPGAAPGGPGNPPIQARRRVPIPPHGIPRPPVQRGGPASTLPPPLPPAHEAPPPAVAATSPPFAFSHPAGDSLAAATTMTAAPQPAGPTATQTVLQDSPGFKMFQETRIIEI